MTACAHRTVSVRRRHSVTLSLHAESEGLSERPPQTAWAARGAWLIRKMRCHFEVEGTLKSEWHGLKTTGVLEGQGEKKGRCFLLWAGQGGEGATEENVSYSLRGWHAGPGGRRRGLAGSWKAVSPQSEAFLKKKKVIVYRKLKENGRRRGPRAWSSAAGCVPVALRLAEPREPQCRGWRRWVGGLRPCAQEPPAGGRGNTRPYFCVGVETSL